MCGLILQHMNADLQVVRLCITEDFINEFKKTNVSDTWTSTSRFTFVYCKTRIQSKNFCYCNNYLQLVISVVNLLVMVFR